MFFKKEEEIRDLLFLDKNEYFIDGITKTSITIHNEVFSKVINNRFFFNNDNIYDKEIDDYITLRDMLLTPEGYGYFEKDQFEEAEFIASKYNLKITTSDKHKTNNYNDFVYELID